MWTDGQTDIGTDGRPTDGKAARETDVRLLGEEQSMRAGLTVTRKF